LGLFAYIGGIWGIHTHTFEGDDLFYLQGSSFGRPLADALFFGIQSFFGNNPTVFHIVLVLLHLVAAITGGMVVFFICNNTRIATYAGILFLINVSHYRVLHWISCIGYPMGLIFGLLCLLFLLKRRYILASIFIFLSVISHPAAFFIPLVVGLRNYAVRKYWMVISFGLMTIFLIILIYPDTPHNEATTSLSIQAIELFLWQCGRLVTTFLFLFPKLQDIYTTDILAGCGLFLLCLFLIYKKQDISLWAGLTITTTLPFIANHIGAWPTGPSRYLYFASFGFCVLIGTVLQKIKQTYATTLIIIILAISAIGLQKSRAMSAYMEGRGQVAHGDLKTGLTRFEFAIRQAPSLIPFDIYERASILSLASGKTLEVILQSAPDVPEISALRAASALLENDNQKCRIYLEPVIEALPNPELSTIQARAFMTVASYLLYINQNEKSLKTAQMALEFKRDYEPAQRVLQMAKTKIGTNP